MVGLHAQSYSFSASPLFETLGILHDGQTNHVGCGREIIKGLGEVGFGGGGRVQEERK